MDDQLNFLDLELENLKQPYAKQATEFFSSLAKAVKARLVYPSSSKLPTQFKKDLVLKATELLENIDVLDYKITSNNILYGDTSVYESSSRTENFAHVFFRDGLVGLSFRQGIDEDELGRLVNLIAKMMRTVYVDDDIATLLWEENFQFIEYNLVDEGLDIETVEYSVENFKSETQARDKDIQMLFQESGEITFEEGDFGDDLSATGSPFQSNAYNRIPQQAYDFLNHISELSQSDKDQIAEFLAEDMKFDHTMYLLTVIFEILGMEKEIPGYIEVLGFIGMVRDDFIKLGNFKGASKLLNRMHELLDGLSNLKSKRAEKIEGFFLECASKEKIEFVTRSVNEIKDLDSEGLKGYLKQLPWAAIDPLLYSLGELDDYNARLAVCSVLAELGQDQIDLIARGLDDERWYVVRNVVMVLSEIAQPKIINYLKKTIRHPDFRVRQETLAAAAKVNSPDSNDFMILALSDPDVKIQISSLNYLIEHKASRAFKAIEHIIKDKKFKDRPSEQMKKYYEAYAVLGQGNALAYLKPMATKKFIFASSKDERLRLFSIGALANIKSVDAREILKKIAQSKNKKVAMAAMRALSTKK